MKINKRALLEFIDTLVEEEEIDEISTSAGAGAYSTPNAFSSDKSGSGSQNLDKHDPAAVFSEDPNTSKKNTINIKESIQRSDIKPATTLKHIRTGTELVITAVMKNGDVIMKVANPGTSPDTKKPMFRRGDIQKTSVNLLLKTKNYELNPNPIQEDWFSKIGKSNPNTKNLKFPIGSKYLVIKVIEVESMGGSDDDLQPKEVVEIVKNITKDGMVGVRRTKGSDPEIWYAESEVFNQFAIPMNRTRSSPNFPVHENNINIGTRGPAIAPFSSVELESNSQLKSLFNKVVSFIKTKKLFLYKDLYQFAITLNISRDESEETALVDRSIATLLNRNVLKLSQSPDGPQYKWINRFVKESISFHDKHPDLAKKHGIIGPFSDETKARELAKQYKRVAYSFGKRIYLTPAEHGSAFEKAGFKKI